MGCTSSASAGTDVDFRFIDFKLFKDRGKLPSFSQDASLTCSIGSIDRESSLLIFISHCWIHSAGGTSPDFESHSKFQLCVSGIESVLKNLASKMANCYVWIDCGCCDQRSIGDIVSHYHEMIEVCDVVFTPVVDKERQWKLPAVIHSYLIDYKAPLWNKGPNSYLNRAWCRAEMLLASSIPSLKDANSAKRYEKFDGVLAHACRLKRRPHLLYGSREMDEGKEPLALPHMRASYLDDYDPLLGNLSVPSDVQYIKCLLQAIKVYVAQNKAAMGYEGDVDVNGLRQGWGVDTNAEGDLYEGQWKDNNRSGQGTFYFVDGSVYEGEWKEGVMEGKGVYRFPDGTVGEGDYLNGVLEGKGVCRFPNGDVYDGDFKRGIVEGTGTYTYPNGDVCEGQFRGGLREGPCTYRWANGDVFFGEYRAGVREGKGTCTYASGEVVEGVYKDDIVIGA